MLVTIDFIDAVDKVELMKQAVHKYMREKRGGAEVIHTSYLTHYIPEKAEFGSIYFRLDYRTFGQSPTTLSNLARESFTSDQINAMINHGKAEV